jgi:hypothetical protein
VPFVNFVAKDGTPDLRILDQARVAACVNGWLCAICGMVLDSEVVFMGGEVCEKNLFFADPAMHEECARYAKAVCPFLALQGYHHSRTNEPRKKDKGTVFAANPLAPPEGSKRPERMVMVFTRSFCRVVVDGHRLIKSGQPIRTEWF